MRLSILSRFSSTCLFFVVAQDAVNRQCESHGGHEAADIGMQKRQVELFGIRGHDIAPEDSGHADREADHSFDSVPILFGHSGLLVVSL